MKQLIVNADDFGLYEEINNGIIKGHREGFITSTSLMCSAPAFDQAVDLAKNCPKLGIGIHLTLVGGVKPVLPPTVVSSLLDGQGLFPNSYVDFAKRYYTGGVKALELEKELRAQIERGLSTDLKITHIDSHQHTHVLPGVASLVQKLCLEYGIKRIRIPAEAIGFTGGFEAGLGRKIGRAGLTFCAKLAMAQAHGRLQFPNHFFGMLAGGNLNVTRVGAILAALPEGVSEIMTHPGLNGEALGKLFPWYYHWEEELAAYLADSNKQILESRHIKLINFGDLNE